MNKYINTYTIQVEFDAEDDVEASEIDSRNLTAILSAGEFCVKTLKIERDIFEYAEEDKE